MMSRDYTGFLRVMFEVGWKLHSDELVRAAAELIHLAHTEGPGDEEDTE